MVNIRGFREALSSEESETGRETTRGGCVDEEEGGQPPSGERCFLF
jgi:hypothetical protein